MCSTSTPARSSAWTTKRFVYVQDENGLRAMAEVETGFEADGFVEILSGLEEGDAVILK